MIVAVKPIRLFGDPVLRTPAEPVRDFDTELRKLVKDLTETMVDAPGTGLAAPQIGVGLRVFTYHVEDEFGHLINPSLDLSDETETGEEGCLSIPGLAFPTERALRTVAKGYNVYGEPVTVEGPALEALLASRHEVAAVLTRPDAPAGRGHRRTGRPARQGPVAARAREAGLEVLAPARAGDPAFLDRLRRIN